MTLATLRNHHDISALPPCSPVPGSPLRTQRMWPHDHSRVRCMIPATFPPHFTTTLGGKPPAPDARHAFGLPQKSEQTMAQTPNQTTRTGSTHQSGTPSQATSKAPSDKTISSNVFKDFASI